MSTPFYVVFGAFPYPVVSPLGLSAVRARTALRSIVA